jgi:hypothetical protein
MSFPGGQNLEQVRQVDALWSQYVQGYAHQARVMTALFPLAGVPNRKGTVIKFGRDSFRLSQTKRAPGTQLRVRKFTHGSDSYVLDDHGEQLIIPMEEIEEGAVRPGTSIVQDHMDQFLETQTLRHEYDAAQIATTAANYASGHFPTTAGADQWDAADASPTEQIRAYKETISGKIGREPNTLVLGVDAYVAATENGRIRDQLKYTSKESITPEILAAVFDLDTVVVARSVYDDADGTSAKVFTADAAVLAYVDPGTNLMAPDSPRNGGRGHGGSITSPAGGTAMYSRRRPAYGYTYVVDGYPIISGEFYDEDRNSFKYPYLWPYGIFHTLTDDDDNVVAGMLIQDIV